MITVRKSTSIPGARNLNLYYSAGNYLQMTAGFAIIDTSASYTDTFKYTVE